MSIPLQQIPSRESTAPVSVPAWAAGAGFASVASVTFGVVASHGGHPAYSLALHYVSQLAEAQNPRWWWFCAGLVAGGVLLTPFAWSVRKLLPNADGARASALAMVAGGSMTLVGFFPLTRIVPHFACAFVLFASAIFAELFAARSLSALARQTGCPRLRAASLVAYALFALHVAASVGGFVYSAVVTRHMPMLSAEQMLRESPVLQQVRLGESGLVINPVANLEWVFLLTSMGLISAASFRAWRLRVAPPT
jgi:hypothetical membrane protein